MVSTKEKLAKTDIRPWSVPRSWDGETAVVIGSGPSLTSSQIDLAFKSGARVLGIKDAFLVAAAMDLHYCCDAWWLDYHINGCRKMLNCPMVTQDRNSAIKHDLLWVQGINLSGLSVNPEVIHTGSNSGYQAVNLAVHLGAKKICLIGFDMRVSSSGADHWFGQHPHKRIAPYGLFLEAFKTVPAQLEELGVEIINCTPRSALNVFPMATLEDALK